MDPEACGKARRHDAQLSPVAPINGLAWIAHYLNAFPDTTTVPRGSTPRDRSSRYSP